MSILLVALGLWCYYLSQCRELRDLLLLDSQDPPSSPSPLLEAFEALAANLDLTPDSTLLGETISDPVPWGGLPLLSDLKLKSKTFPPPNINRNANLFLQMVTKEISYLSTQFETQNWSPTHYDALSQLKTQKSGN